MGTEAPELSSLKPPRAEEAKPRLSRRIDTLLGARRSLLLVAVVIGIAGGFGAVFFRYLIGLFQDIAWGAGGTPFEKFARAPYYLRLTVPALGGLLVGLIVKYMAPETKGHGVPEVMNAVARLGGVIRPIVAVAKSLASAVCIAAGGSVGREGPIVQIGSAMGSTVGQVLKLSTRRLRTCVGCGAAAGIAATFNAPIGGAFFAAEVILGEFGVGAFSAVIVSAVSATVVSRIFLGNTPAFSIPAYEIIHPAEVINYAFLGVLAGGAAVLFVWTLYFFEEFFDRLKSLPEPIKPVLGGFGIGAIGLAVPEVMGVGYDTITEVLHSRVIWTTAIVLLGSKLLATTLTLGSGGSGGVFAPSLFLGAALGTFVGEGAQAVFSFPMAPPGAYAVVGMGALVAAATHAPITAMLIIFEMTGDYHVILGLMLSCVLGTVVAQRLSRGSIYTIKLLRRGIDLHKGHELNVLRRLTVRDVMRPDVATVRPNATLADLCRLMSECPHWEFFVVDDEGRLIGAVSADEIRQALLHRSELSELVIASDLMTTPVIYVRENDNLEVAMQQFGKRLFEELPVVPAHGDTKPIGTIRRHDVINAYNKEILKTDLPGSVSSRVAASTRLRTWETVGDYVLAYVEVPPHLWSKPLRELELRRCCGIEVMLIERSEGEDGQYDFPSGDSVFNPGDRALIFGKRDNVERFLETQG